RTRTIAGFPSADAWDRPGPDRPVSGGSGRRRRYFVAGAGASPPLASGGFLSRQLRTVSGSVLSFFARSSLLIFPPTKRLIATIWGQVICCWAARVSGAISPSTPAITTPPANRTIMHTSSLVGLAQRHGAWQAPEPGIPPAMAARRATALRRAGRDRGAEARALRSMCGRVCRAATGQPCRRDHLSVI